MTDIPKFPELAFEENTHTYKLNGIIIPSVSQLMEPLSNNFYKSVPPSSLEKAAFRGTAIHNAIQNYIDYGIADIAPEYEGYLVAFIGWWNRYEPTSQATECRVYHKLLGYAGTSDLLCEINGRLTMVDYKTSANVNSKLCAIQLEGYDRAWDSQGIKIDDRIILHLQSSGQYQAVNFKRDANIWSVFSALMTVKNYMG